MRSGAHSERRLRSEPDSAQRASQGSLRKIRPLVVATAFADQQGVTGGCPRLAIVRTFRTGLTRIRSGRAGRWLGRLR